MVEINDLTAVTLTELHEAFKDAFSDYVVPIHLTTTQLKSKMKRDSIRLDLSSGAFHNGRLVGFIMHGLGLFDNKLSIYNAGTGVLPKFRGRNLSMELFNYTLPKIITSGAQQVTLEVIRENIAALKVYKKLGFKIMRDLICYQEGRRIRISQQEISGFRFQKTKKPDLESLKKMWDWNPSWQNSMEAVQRIADAHSFILVKHKHKTVGYAAFVNKTGYISQFAVDTNFRRNKIGTNLFWHMQQESKKGLILINADKRDGFTQDFLKSLGFRPFIHQLEMILPVNG